MEIHKRTAALSSQFTIFCKGTDSSQYMPQCVMSLRIICSMVFAHFQVDFILWQKVNQMALFPFGRKYGTMFLELCEPQRNIRFREQVILVDELFEFTEVKRLNVDTLKNSLGKPFYRIGQKPFRRKKNVGIVLRISSRYKFTSLKLRYAQI